MRAVTTKIEVSICNIKEVTILRDFVMRVRTCVVDKERNHHFSAEFPSLFGLRTFEQLALQMSG